MKQLKVNQSRAIDMVDDRQMWNNQCGPKVGRWATFASLTVSEMKGWATDYSRGGVWNLEIEQKNTCARTFWASSVAFPWGRGKAILLDLGVSTFQALGPWLAQPSTIKYWRQLGLGRPSWGVWLSTLNRNFEFCDFSFAKNSIMPHQEKKKKKKTHKNKKLSVKFFSILLWYHQFTPWKAKLLKTSFFGLEIHQPKLNPIPKKRPTFFYYFFILESSSYANQIVIYTALPKTFFLTFYPSPS